MTDSPPTPSATGSSVSGPRYRLTPSLGPNYTARKGAADPGKSKGHAPRLHRLDGNHQYRAPRKPGPNEPCECQSGRKAKKCHPDGFQPRVNRVEKGACSGCGAKDAVVVPLRHQGIPGWVENLCGKCLRDDALVARIIERARASQPPPLVLTASPGVAVRAVVPGSEQAMTDLPVLEPVEDAHVHHDHEAVIDSEPGA